MEVFWSRNAELSFNEEVEFINIKWGNREVERFLTLVEDFIETLKSGVLSGRKSSKRDVYFSVISRQTTLIYSINKQDDSIELLLFWDNKRDPKKLEKFLNK